MIEAIEKDLSVQSVSLNFAESCIFHSEGLYVKATLPREKCLWRRETKNEDLGFN